MSATFRLNGKKEIMNNKYTAKRKEVDLRTVRAYKRTVRTTKWAKVVVRTEGITILPMATSLRFKRDEKSLRGTM